MSSTSFTIVGLASNRSPWMARLSYWVTSGSLSAELFRCVSVEEIRSVLRTRSVSMALVDELSRHVDRDLLAAVQAAGAVPVVVVGRPARRDWHALGASATLPEDFDVTNVAELLRTRARPVDAGRRAGTDPVDAPDAAGRLVTVCGPGGTGASTVACAVAQGLASALPAQVVLADMTLNGEQAVLHGADGTGLGLPALVEAHRRGRVDADDLHHYLVDVTERSYGLLMGIRRSRAWSTIRPRALRAAVSNLLGRYELVVADTDADVEGEPDGGSLDIEERNGMSRFALGHADVVVVVGSPGVKGTYGLQRVIEDLTEFGVSRARIIPVVNRFRGSRSDRREHSGALRDLVPGPSLHAPVFLPDRDVEAAVVDGAALPGWLTDPITCAVLPLLGGPPLPGRLERDDATPEPAATPLAPGALGLWTARADRPA